MDGLKNCEHLQSKYNFSGTGDLNYMNFTVVANHDNSLLPSTVEIGRKCSFVCGSSLNMCLSDLPEFIRSLESIREFAEDKKLLPKAAEEKVKHVIPVDVDILRHYHMYVTMEAPQNAGIGSDDVKAKALRMLADAEDVDEVADLDPSCPFEVQDVKTVTPYVSDSWTE